jgi:site-specific DNA-methyltransferase (adenine-specific)
MGLDKKLINKVHCGDSSEILKLYPDDCIDLYISSPPYDLLRTYKGYKFNFCKIAKHMARTLKPGGVIVWVVNDMVINGSESGSSLKQALYFMQKCGLNIHDTMIWQKTFLKYPEKIRYHQSFEYMFVLSKGKPKTINILEDRENFWAGSLVPGKERQYDGTKREACKTGKKYKKIGARWNVWAFGLNGEKVDLGRPEKLSQKQILYYVNRGYVILDPHGSRCNVWAMKNTYDRYLKESGDHPAVFPEELVRDHVLTWTNEYDIVGDICSGSGTTPVISKTLNRYYMAIDISEEYVKNQIKRLKKTALFQPVSKIKND